MTPRDDLAAYLHMRAGNKPEKMTINGAPRTIFRDYKGRGVMVVVAPDTYDVVRALTVDNIEQAYLAGNYRRWHYDGADVHEVEVERDDARPASVAGESNV